MRGTPLAILAVFALAACEPAKEKVGALKVTEGAPDPGALWPVMLQHCLRSPSCDPMSDFGQGVGQASGRVDQADFFVETAGVVKEGGQDYGAALTLSLYGIRGEGGAAGRPLSIDEAPLNLRANKARRSTLSIEYRTPGGGKPEPYFLTFHSAQLVLTVPGVEKGKSQEEIASITAAWIEGLTWPSGDTGAKIEISGKGGALYTGYSAGIGVFESIETEDAVRRGFEPWWLYAPRNLRDEPLPGLMKAIEAGDTLSLKVTAPDGGVMLSDAFYTGGYSEALRHATAALADPEIGRPIQERCVRFADEKDEFWKIADVAPALLVCDPRTLEQKYIDGAPRVPRPTKPNQ